MTETKFDNILAIDTATHKLNLALRFGGDRSVTISDKVEKTHGQLIMKRIDDLFHNAGLSVADLHAIVVSLGPGSFTGLRIGLAAAKGIATARSLPMVGISLFDVAAYRLRADDPPAHVLIPSRKGEYYVGNWEGGPIGRDRIQIVAESDLASKIGSDPAYGIGFDPSKVDPPITAVVAGGELEYDGADLLQVGGERLDRGDFDDLAELEPIYLQKAIAEIRFDEKHEKR
jgi:tRNA threonylcarbamoyl adenosine modification protein YeaZ